MDDKMPNDNTKVPAISVCMPVYNGKTFLPRAFQSLAAQTFRDFEIIIVDDGSTDGSANEGQRLLLDNHLQGTVIRTTNQGAEQARDVACAHARAMVIAHLDCDDIWDSSYLSTMIAILKSHPDLDLVYCDILQESAEGGAILKSAISPWIDLSQASREKDLYIFPSGRFFKLLLGGIVLLPSCTVYTKALYKRAGPYSASIPEARTSLDWYFGLRASRSGTIAFLRRPLVRRYLHGANASGDLVKLTTWNVRVLQSILADRTLSKDERRIACAKGAVISIWACDITLRIDQNHWSAIKWALTSLRFRINWHAARMLVLSLIPRFFVEGVRKIQATVRN